MNALPAIAVMLPLIGAGATLALGRRSRAQAVITVVVLVALVVVGALLMAHVNKAGTVVLDVGSWAAPVGITLVADKTSALLVLVSAIVLLAVFCYSLAQSGNSDEEAPVAIFHPTYLVLAAGVMDAFLAGDLFNLFVAFEILLASSFVLLTLGGTGSRIRSGAIYVVVSLLASLLLLTAIGLIYGATGTLNLAQLSTRLSEIDPRMSLVLHVMLILAFAIKAAIFPLASWLPDSYPIAPAPVTAVFAGLLTKVGVYAILRTETLLFPGGQLSTVLLILASATMLVGILGAVAQDDLKRLLSFTLVSHIGYMIFGIAIASQLALSAALVYIAHHITVQTALFLVTGLIEHRTGTTSLSRLGGLARVAPALAAGFFLPALNLAGVPPFSGFLAKLGLLEAGAAANAPWAWVGFAVGLITSLLTLYAVIKAWNRAFWQDPPEILTHRRTSWGMVAPAAVLVVLGLAAAGFGGPLYKYTDDAAAELRDPASYRQAVLVGGERGNGTSDTEGEHDG